MSSGPNVAQLAAGMAGLGIAVSSSLETRSLISFV
jgi:hypothetical protein